MYKWAVTLGLVGMLILTGCTLTAVAQDQFHNIDVQEGNKINFQWAMANEGTATGEVRLVLHDRETNTRQDGGLAVVPAGDVAAIYANYIVPVDGPSEIELTVIVEEYGPDGRAVRFHGGDVVFLTVEPAATGSSTMRLDGPLSWWITN